MNPPAASPLRPPAPAPAAPPWRWTVRVLGGVQATCGDRTLTRWPSRAVAALLARLALAPGRAHAREELCELLWPGVDLAVARNRLRQALSTLKSLLEPDPRPELRVIDADRLHLRVCPGTLDCDALHFEALVRAGRHEEARALYAGELLPGHYDEWIHDERQRLAALRARLPEAAAPPARPAAAVVARAALPSYLTRLFGTEMPAARLHALVRTQRLVTLVGPGGSGKTRLAVEVAAALAEQPGWDPPQNEGPARGFDRLVFISLVSCRDGLQMLDAMARGLGLPGAQTAADLVPALAGLQVLLVLDNLEQLARPAQEVLAHLVSALPGLHVLATSRRRLGLDGEVLFQAESLALPQEGAPLAEAATNPAVALFVDRARAARSDFHLTEGNHAAVAALVCRLQGLPLAIELAASRARSFAPAELLGLLQATSGPDRLALLARDGGRSGRDGRHASMIEVIAWSWNLLDTPTRQVLLALSVFPGSAAAAGVAATADLPLPQAAARLDDLVSHSLARAVPGETTRFDLLEPVREFTALQAGDTSVQRERLHAWLLAWARALPRPLRRTAVAPELPAVHALLAQAGQASTATQRVATELFVSLRDHWESETLPVHTLQSLEAALAPLPVFDPLRADAHELLAGLRFGTGFADAARVHAEAALAAAGSDRARRARALVRRAWVDVAAGRSADRASPQHARARALLDEALALAEAAGDCDAQARALTQQGILTAHLHASLEGADIAGAEALFARAEALWRALGDRRRAHARLRNRAQCWAQLGRLDEAMVAYRRCEQVALEDGDWLGEIDSLISMAELQARQRQWPSALETSRRGLALCWRHWHRHAMAYALWNPPRMLARLGQPETAARLMAFAAVFWTSQFGPLSRQDELHLRRVRRLVAMQIGMARTEELWQQGQALDVARAVRLLLPAG